MQCLILGGDQIMKFLTAAASALALSAAATAVSAACDDGEIVVKFSHVTNTDKHPKGIAASLLEQRVNEEMDGTMCMEVFPNSTLYDDNKVLEAMLQGDVQLAAPSLSKFEKFTKQFRIFDLPFMFKNIDAVDAFQNPRARAAFRVARCPRPRVPRRSRARRAFRRARRAVARVSTRRDARRRRADAPTPFERWRRTRSTCSASSSPRATG